MGREGRRLGGRERATGLGNLRVTRTVPRNKHSSMPQLEAVRELSGAAEVSAEEAVEEDDVELGAATQPVVHSIVSLSPLRVTAAITVPAGMRDAPAPCRRHLAENKDKTKQLAQGTQEQQKGGANAWAA